MVVRADETAVGSAAAWDESAELLPNYYNVSYRYSNGTYNYYGVSYGINDWYSQLMDARTYETTGKQLGNAENASDKAVVYTEGDEKGELIGENILWTEEPLHLRKAWLYGASQIIPDTGNLQYNGSTTVTTPALQFGDTYTAKLTAMNYGDRALDGVSMTYVLPKGVMPRLNEDNELVLEASDGTPTVRAYYGADYSAANQITLDRDHIKITARPASASELTEADLEKIHLAPKAPGDPVRYNQFADKDKADKPYNYSRIPENAAWVIEITMDKELGAWWNRGTNDVNHRISVEIPCVVVAQPDQEAYFDALYVSPYDDGQDFGADGEILPSELYYQIYDDSYAYRYGNSYYKTPETIVSNGRYLYADTFLHGEDYGAAGSGADFSTITKNLVINDRFEKQNSWDSDGDGTDDTRKSVRTGAQAILAKPMMRHWAEVSDEKEDGSEKTGAEIAAESKFDEFFQNVESPFKVRLITENQLVMTNIKSGGDLRYGRMEETPYSYYMYPNYQSPYGESTYAPYLSDVTGSQKGAKYPLPAITAILPERMVPMMADGSVYYKNADGTDELMETDQLSFTMRTFKVSTLKTDANKETTDGSPFDMEQYREHYKVYVGYEKDIDRYIVKFIPSSPTYADDYESMNQILEAPMLPNNESLMIEIGMMPIGSPDDTLENGDSDPELLKKWQSLRSFAGSTLPGFKFVTDDASNASSNKGLVIDGTTADKKHGNYFYVGKAYAGTDMVNGNGVGYSIYSPYYGRNYSGQVFHDTRLDSTGYDGRINSNDRVQFLGRMVRISEADNDGKAFDLNVEDYKERQEKNISYDSLDLNGNSQVSRVEEGKMISDECVMNQMYVYTKRPNIMLDMRMSLTVDEDGVGDDNGSPDYKGRDAHTGQAVCCDDYPMCDHDYFENPNALSEEDIPKLGYNDRVWYTITVKNQPSESVKLEKVTDPDTGKVTDQPLYSAGIYQSWDTYLELLRNPNEGASQDLQRYYGGGYFSGMPLVNVKQNSRFSSWDNWSRIRQRKVTESGDVAHGAFVFSQYLPEALAYDRELAIATYKEDGTIDQLLTKEEAEKQGWTIIDNTELPTFNENGVKKDNVKFVSVTVIPPAMDRDGNIMADGGFAGMGEGESFSAIAQGDRPAGYLASGQRFALKIRTRVSDLPELGAEDNYDENGVSKDQYAAHAFVNLERLDGDYESLTGNQEEKPAYTYDQFLDQNRDMVSYYSGTTGYGTEEKVVVKDGKDLPEGFVKDNVIPEPQDQKWNQQFDNPYQTEYAVDTSFGIKVTAPSGYAKYNMNPALIRTTGSFRDPGYHSTDVIHMYLGEGTLLTGGAGALYLVDNIPLYGLPHNKEMPDLVASNIGSLEDAQDVKQVVNHIETVRTGKWSIPEDDNLYESMLMNPSQEEIDEYKKDLEEKLKVHVFYTIREETGDERAEIPKEGFDPEQEDDIWHEIPGTQGGKVGIHDNVELDFPKQANGDWINVSQIMIAIYADDRDYYPVPTGFRLDVDNDLSEEGNQDMHEMQNPIDRKKGTGHYPYHMQEYETSEAGEGGTPAVENTVENNGAFIRMTSGTNYPGVIYTAHYSQAYINYSDDHYEKLEGANIPEQIGDSDDSGEELYKVNPENDKIFSKTGIILLSKQPIAKLTIKDR